jgi:hypothetical protein
LDEKYPSSKSRAHCAEVLGTDYDEDDKFGLLVSQFYDLDRVDRATKQKRGDREVPEIP